jgi:hypothetical protein
LHQKIIFRLVIDDVVAAAAVVVVVDAVQIHFLIS